MISVKKLLYKILNRLHYVPFYGAITGASLPDVNLASSATGWKAIASFTLPDGVWLVYLTCVFASNATGFRIATIAEASAVAGTVIRTVRISATPSAVTTIAINCPLVGGRTYYINGLQNSGSTLKVETRYTAVKIGEDTTSAS